MGLRSRSYVDRSFQEVGQTVRSLFPDIFSDRRPRPLAIGILDDLALALPDVAKTRIRAFLKVWTQTSEYLSEVSRGAARVRLDGSIAEEMDERHRSAAKTRLNTRAKPKQQPAKVRPVVNLNRQRQSKPPTVVVVTKKRRVFAGVYGR